MFPNKFVNNMAVESKWQGDGGVNKPGFIKRIKLQTKIALLIILILFISIMNIALYITSWRISDIRGETEINIMNVATIVANAPTVKENLGKKGTENAIQNYVKTILQSTKHIEIIVVVDMNDIRYAHPNEERIGQKFVGGDEDRVLNNGESYISEAVGTLGKQLRAFVPVFNDKTQVGFVMVGQTTASIKKTIYEAIKLVAISSLLGLFIGAAGAFILSRIIKDSLLGLEPEQISKLFLQKEEILQAMHEGIIAIDKNHKITLINNSAQNMLKLYGQDILGKNILEIFPKSKLIDVMKSGTAEYYQEQVINDTLVVVNRVPIREGSRIEGAIATFNDKTMVARLAEEITGVNQIVDALRANTHEFMNKLHVILGLIQIGEQDEARKFILSETEKQQEIVNLVIGKIKDPTIAGLILGKISRAKELGINMYIDKKSHLEKMTGRINSNVLITILGNLIENAMESLSKCELFPKTINIYINENPDVIEIIVQDTGCGIEKENLCKIFDKGFTTKEGNRGRGLYHIKQLVEGLLGKIEVESETGKGAEFTVLLPKGGSKID